MADIDVVDDGFGRRVVDLSLFGWDEGKWIGHEL